MQTSSPFSTTSRFLTTAPLLFFAVLLALCGTRFVPAQQVEVQVADKVEEEDKAEEEIDVDLDAKEEEIAQEASIEAEFPGGAGLKTDPELETYLKRAEQFVDEGRFDLATILWQRVLDESGETVMTRPSWTYESFERKYRKYQSVSEEIERTIANLPPAGLRQYRRAADGEARAILAGGAGTGGAAAGAAGAVENREPALSDVVRLYFMSSLGDVAAYELACARLDRYDFVGAGRLLSRILNDYPDSDVPRSELLLRLALANARLGDLAAARSALAQLDVAADAGALRRAAAMIQREVDAGAAARADTQAPDAWHLPWGGPQRTGHMQPPPKSITNDTLSEAWFDNFEIDDGFLATAQQMRNQILAHGGFAFQSRARKQQGNAGPPTRDELLARWKSNGWQPTGQMLLHEGFVYYKRHNRVVCRDAETGRLQWMSRRSTYKPPAPHPSDPPSSSKLRNRVAASRLQTPNHTTRRPKRGFQQDSLVFDTEEFPSQ